VFFHSVTSGANRRALDREAIKSFQPNAVSVSLIVYTGRRAERFSHLGGLGGISPKIG
jgi:hypothetical protein